ncbi:hypothetical protein OH76DRAFT_305236 [Lentinus brumalis]|uniref:Uncharacterized protein n=1 Tax=Lentinus brumalis TaxID=2498619 RepID=A0A371CKF5_9APHY|nr:hypothetical protein OH76DRAFT_305236 [Polyporus brumalis]
MFPATLARERAAAASPEASNTTRTSHDACTAPYVFTPTMSSRRVGARRTREREPERERLNPRAYALNMTKLVFAVALYCKRVFQLIRMSNGVEYESRSRNAYIQYLHAAPTHRTASQPPTHHASPVANHVRVPFARETSGPGGEEAFRGRACVLHLYRWPGDYEWGGGQQRAGCCQSPRTHRSLLQPRNPVPLSYRAP